MGFVEFVEAVRIGRVVKFVLASSLHVVVKRQVEGIVHENILALLQY